MVKLTNLEKVKLIAELREEETPRSKKYVFSLHSFRKIIHFSAWDKHDNLADIVTPEFYIDNDCVNIAVKGSYDDKTINAMEKELTTWLKLNYIEDLKQ